MRLFEWTCKIVFEYNLKEKTNPGGVYLNTKKSLLIRTTDILSICHLKSSMIYRLITLRCKKTDNENKASAWFCGFLNNKLQVTSCELYWSCQFWVIFAGIVYHTVSLAYKKNLCWGLEIQSKPIGKFSR